MAQLTDLRATLADAWRDPVFAHLATSHHRLGGDIETAGPLRLFANETYDWTFFNTSRQVDAIATRDIDWLIRYVIRFYDTRQLRPAWDLSDRLAPTALAALLTHAGFVLDRGEALMARAVRTAADRPPTADRRSLTALSTPPP